MSERITYLYFDGDSGSGGASKSLFLTISTIFNERDLTRVGIFLRRENRFLERYQKMGLKVFPLDSLPKMRPTRKKTYLQLPIFFFLAIRNFDLFRKVRQIQSENAKILIHLNHENLVFFGLMLRVWLRPFKMVLTARTILFPSVLSWINRFLAVIITDKIIFIAEPVRSTYEQFLSCSLSRASGSVVPNVFVSDKLRRRQPGQFDTIKFLCLSNYTYNRGVDRAVSFAQALKNIDPQFSFTISLFGREGSGNDQIWQGKSISYREYIGKLIDIQGLGGVVLVNGYTEDPVSELLQSHFLIRFNRFLPSPWGRDVIEALNCGVPVIATGERSEFVINNQNGLLFESFDEKLIADTVYYLINDKKRYSAMVAATSRNVEKCQPCVHKKLMNECYEECGHGFP